MLNIHKGVQSEFRGGTWHSEGRSGLCSRGVMHAWRTRTAYRSGGAFTYSYQHWPPQLLPKEKTKIYRAPQRGMSVNDETSMACAENVRCCRKVMNRQSICTHPYILSYVI